MLEKGKISAFQMAVVMYPTIVGTVIISVPAVTGKYAKNDLWLSPIWASAVGFLIVYIAFQLHKMYPGQSIIQYSESIIGRLPGKILAWFYLLFYLMLNGHAMRIYGEFIVGVFLPETQLSVVIATIIFFCALAVYAGLEVVGRLGQLLLPIFIFPFLLIVILLLPHLEPGNIFPIMENGMMPSIHGAAVPQEWFGEFLLISFLLPFLSDAGKGRKWAMIAVFVVMITLVITNLLILFLLGEVSQIYAYPLLTAARYISIGNFFENLESVVMAIWILGNFVKFSLVYYCVVLGTAQWLKLSDYRPLVFPLGLWTILFSFWGLPSEMKSDEFVVTADLLYYPTFQLLIPAFLLLIAWIKKRKKRPRTE